MPGTPHNVENVPPDKGRQGEQQPEEPQQSAGSSEAPTGPRPGGSDDEPGTERDSDREGPTPGTENPAN